MCSRKPIKTCLDVLSIISNPAGWTGGIIGGGEIRAVEVLKRWHSLGVHVQTLETTPSPSLIMGGEYKVHMVSLLLRRTGLVTNIFNTVIILFEYLYMLRYITSKSHLVVASTSNFTDVFPAWIFSKFWRIPFTIVFQISSYTHSLSTNYRVGREEGYGIGSSLIRTVLSLIVIRLARQASTIFCLSKPIMDMLRELNFPQERLRLTSMGLNPKEIEAVIANNHQCDGIFLGRVEWAKGINDLLEAWKIIIEQRPNAKLLIAGTGGFLENAKQYVKRTRMVSNVKLVGFIKGKERYAYLKSGKIFIYPSRIKEGWGLAIAEAMACGLPVVCSKNPVFLNVFGGCKGVTFVPVGDVEMLAGAILHLLRDEEILRRYGQAAKAYTQEYDWESVARHDLRVLENIRKIHHQTNR